MQNKTELAKVCDNFAKKRQLCDNFATTEKRKNSNKIIRDIYIFKEVVATFLLVSAYLRFSPPLGLRSVGPTATHPLPLYGDNFLRQLLATTSKREAQVRR
jgi:hypothetical protein